MNIDLGVWEPRDFAAALSAIIAIVALVVSYFVNKRTLETARANTEATAWQKANETEVTAIQARLDGFFGPYRQMSGINRLLSRDLRARQADERFLLIEKLFDRAWRTGLPAGEKALVAEIAANAKTLREFLAEHAGMVDAAVLPYLSRASAHYRMLELAFEEKLGEDPAPFVARYVFPAQIDEVLRLEVERLERRLAALRAAPFGPPPKAELLVLPAELGLKDWPNPPRAARPELNMPVGPT